MEDFAEPVEALPAAGGVLREVHVQQDDVVGFVFEEVGDHLRVFFRVDKDGVLLEEQAGGEEDVFVVVDDEDFVEGFAHGKTLGVPFKKNRQIWPYGGPERRSPGTIGAGP